VAITIGILGDAVDEESDAPDLAFDRSGNL
jgi:hypothetical protein